MLTKAIIQSVDYTKNLCRVRIPLFENASRNVNMIEAEAQFSIVPGVYNSYKTGDVVFIGFEENKMELPIILGKLFVSTASEASSHRGNLSGNSLSITDTVQLPYSTIFNYDKISQNSSVYKNLNTPKKLADSILNLQNTQVQRYQTAIKVAVGDSIYKLYLKTTNDFTYTSDKSEEPLYRLCTALKNSQVDVNIIPLDSAIIEKEETIVENDIEKKEIIYVSYPASIQIQEFTAERLRLTVFIDGSRYEIIKDSKDQRNDFLEIKSSAIYY